MIRNCDAINDRNPTFFGAVAVPFKSLPPKEKIRMRVK